MNKIYIWGAGTNAEYVYSMIDHEHCVIEGIVDQNEDKQGLPWNNKLRIGNPEELKSLEFDYVIFSMMNYGDAVSRGKEIGISEEKMIIYWAPYHGVGIFKDKDKQLQKEQKKRKLYENRLESAPYEWGIKPVPLIEDSDKI